MLVRTADGKDHIKEERLRLYDKAKYTIYKALKEELPKVQSWKELKEALSEKDIDMKFKVSRTTKEIQGVKFEYGGFSSSGSKVDREFSYLNINRQFERNDFEHSYSSPQQSFEFSRKEKEEVVSQSHLESSSNFGFGFFNSGSSFDATAADEAEFNRLLKKKKAKHKRGFRL